MNTSNIGGFGYAILSGVGSPAGAGTSCRSGHVLEGMVVEGFAQFQVILEARQIAMATEIHELVDIGPGLRARGQRAA